LAVEGIKSFCGESDRNKFTAWQKMCAARLLAQFRSSKLMHNARIKTIIRLLSRPSAFFMHKMCLDWFQKTFGGRLKKAGGSPLMTAAKM